MTDPIFGKNTSEIYFVGRIEDKNRKYNEDIYLLDTEKRIVERITETYNIKEKLIYCRKAMQ